ncbi:PREDICTED: uncharacterized protein LOC109212287 [Nicotiana attenuata]|uniref:uncharacterized protein LOC109212287 n=1 Tax=Nicotiana attenuata TaxID=49451 RepID=UPI0009058AD9|nr:PREDICTED: uncharacterized protein LOC109212287 [Nicotiana attenuata]
MSTLYPEGKKSFLKETCSFSACGASSRGSIWHRNWNRCSCMMDEIELPLSTLDHLIDSQLENLILTDAWPHSHAQKICAHFSELHNRQSSRETADDAFRAVFEKEQPGRVRCYGRSVMTSSPKKDEEITKLKQKHADEITSLKEEMKEMMREKMRCFFSQMVKNNPGLDFHDIQGCVGSNIHSPVDASSARAMRGQNLPNSSGSTHASNLEKENTDDAIGYGCHKSI